MIYIDDSMRNGLSYDGKTIKFGITLDGKNYIVKTGKGDLSVYCEYIASKFMRVIGVNSHSVVLGLYKGDVVDVIFDFASNYGLYIHSYKDTHQSTEGTDMSDKEYTYKDVIHVIDKNLKLVGKDRDIAINQFWQMFICDAILGNRDRHWGNWGYLGKTGYTNYKIAPIYDNGGSLYPGVYKAIKTINKDRKEFFRQRVEVFPASLFQIEKPDRNYRSNYLKMFSDLRFNKTLAKLTKELRSKLDYKDILNIISNIVMDKDIAVSNEIKLFWIEVVTLRYMCIICRIHFDKAFNIVEKEIYKYEQK